MHDVALMENLSFAAFHAGTVKLARTFAKWMLSRHRATVNNRQCARPDKDPVGPFLVEFRFTGVSPADHDERMRALVVENLACFAGTIQTEPEP